MQLSETHIQVTKTIESILQQGANTLYNCYINQKLPNHAAEQTSQLLQAQFSTPFTKITRPGSLTAEGKPQFKYGEILMPASLKMKGQKSICVGEGEGTQKSERQGERKGFRFSCGNVRGVKVMHDIKTSPGKFSTKKRQKINKNLHKIPNPQTQSQQLKQIRKQKQGQILAYHQKMLQKIQKNQQIQQHHQQIRSQINQLQSLGVPYSYDQDGKLCHLDLNLYKSHRNQIKKQQGNAKKKIIRLYHRTIDLCDLERSERNQRTERNQRNQRSERHPNSSRGIEYSMPRGVLGFCDRDGEERYVSSIVGRKKGYFSSQLSNQYPIVEKRLKMTNEEYNNQNARQNSAVPFVTLSEGIRITEKERNILIQRSKAANQNLQEYREKTGKSLFKSYIPEYQTLSNTLSLHQSPIDSQISIRRPLTTHKNHFTRTKKQVDNETTFSKNKQKLRDSILWRPQTQSKGCRMSICNQELVDKFIDL